MVRRRCSEDSYPQPLLAVAGYGLAGAGRIFPDMPLGAASWSSVLSSARMHRLIGELCSAVTAGTFPATEAQARQVLAAHTSATFWVLSLERELIAVVELLARSAVETRVLKGAAVAHLDYPDPALRSFVDLDILVRAEDFDRAVQVLVGAGFVRRLEQPRPGFDRRFDKGTTLVAPVGYELDLHRTFVLGPWGLRVDLDDLWDGGQEVVVGGPPAARPLAPQPVHARLLPRSAGRLAAAPGLPARRRRDAARCRPRSGGRTDPRAPVARRGGGGRGGRRRVAAAGALDRHRAVVVGGALRPRTGRTS